MANCKCHVCGTEETPDWILYWYQTEDENVLAHKECWERMVMRHV